jgi:hypothetical protein
VKARTRGKAKPVAKRKTKARKLPKQGRKRTGLLFFRNSDRKVQILVFAFAFAVLGGGVYLWQSKASGGYTVQDTVILDKTAPTNRFEQKSRNSTEQGNVSARLMFGGYPTDVALHFRDSSNGATSQITLVATQAPLNQWQDGDIVWSGSDMWVVGGVGTVYLRHYKLAGSPLPTTATLISTQTYGNSDSRSPHMIMLKSGTVVMSWHQQGDTTAPGFWFVTRPISTGAWGSPLFVNQYSWASKQSLVQHPADDTIWLFSISDAFGRMIALNLSETNDGLRLNWNNSGFLNSTHGSNNVDGENSWVDAEADPSTNTIVVAYASNQRNQTYYPKTIVGTNAVSYPNIMRVSANSEKTFTTLPIWIERVDKFSLSVRPGEVWLAYSPIDITTGNFNSVQASRLSSSVWDLPVQLGTKKSTFSHINAVSRKPEFVFFANDDMSHISRIVPVGTPDVLAPPVSTITSPPNGTTASGTVTVSATANDPAGITKVDFLINGAMKYTDVTTPYSFGWNTSNLSSGTYTLSAKVYGNNGNVGISSPITVTVSNTSGGGTDTTSPSVTISSPANNQIVSRKVTIKAAGSDNVAVTKMEVFIDGSLKSSVNGSALSYSWNVGAKQVSKGQHTILIKAYDGAGNMGERSVVVTK